MNIEELTGIVKLVHLRRIQKALKKAGFFDCQKHKELKHASLYEIAIAPYEKTGDFPDGKGNEYNGNLCRDVKGYEQYQFALVQLLAPFRKGCEDLSTKKMLIYAHKIGE